jgi:NTP pyrophosphatase (non-canonical NTP hydrolase)
MMYYLYHIPGKKIGVTTNLEERIHKQQGYYPGEYEVIMSTEDIDFISEKEISLQKALGYKVDRQLYKDLHNNNYKQLNNMNINVTEMTTTFPCPVNKLKGRLLDEIGMQWETEFGSCGLTKKSIKWIMDNVKSSQYTQDRCYVYNKAFARWFDNNDAYRSHDKLGGNLEDAHMKHGLDNAKQAVDQYNGRTRSGALSSAGMNEKSYECCDEKNPCVCKEMSRFDLIREWARERGLYDGGDSKTQALKLVEEVGETCRAILKQDKTEIIDGIGDCVVVLTNLAELNNVSIEDCIDAAYDEISNRTGKMVNGTFKKD